MVSRMLVMCATMNSNVGILHSYIPHEFLKIDVAGQAPVYDNSWVS